VVFAVAVNGRLDVNVALNRPSYVVSQVGTHAPYVFPPHLGNDGNHDTYLHSGNGMCVHTELETNPWWAVDLLVSLFVAGVKLTNRDDAGTYVKTTRVRLNDGGTSKRRGYVC